MLTFRHNSGHAYSLSVDIQLSPTSILFLKLSLFLFFTINL